MIWSYSEADPTDPSGAGAQEHNQMGRRSLNLLGGQPVVNRVAAEDEPFLDITVANVSPMCCTFLFELEYMLASSPGSQEGGGVSTLN